MKKLKKRRAAYNRLLSGLRAVMVDFDYAVHGSCTGKRYSLENQHQDGGWSPLDRCYDDMRLAVEAAASLSRDSIVWGMVRVVDTRFRHVVIEFPAGEEVKT